MNHEEIKVHGNVMIRKSAWGGGKEEEGEEEEPAPCCAASPGGIKSSNAHQSPIQSHAVTTLRISIMERAGPHSGMQLCASLRDLLTVSSAGNAIEQEVHNGSRARCARKVVGVHINALRAAQGVRERFISSGA